MERFKDIAPELVQKIREVYGERLKKIILYGSVARGTDTEESDIDIMLLVDGDAQELRKYSDQLCDVGCEFDLKYCRVFSIIDIPYDIYEQWKDIHPFYRNVGKEGVILFAA